jgi:hypothetical protein
VDCAARFDADRLRIEVDGSEDGIRYRELDRLVWRTEGTSPGSRPVVPAST